LWKKIEEIQQKGGSSFLNNLLNNVDQTSETIFKLISDLEAILQNEEEEDNQLRQKYHKHWNRQTSNELNKPYLENLNEYKSKLIIACNCDQEIRHIIMNNRNLIEL